MLTQVELKRFLKYNPETGIFIWLVNRRGHRGIKVGDIAGSLKNDSGYIFIVLKGKMYRAHRLAFLYMTGRFPPEFVDHKDRNRTNNSWNNLRLATHSQNRMNEGTRKKSGLKGTVFHKKNNKWNARIRLKNKRISLGYFENEQLAHQAYREAAIRLFGEFACME